MSRTALADLLGVEHPIIQAPMAGSTTPELVAAVSNAGALGSIGAAYLTPERIRDEVAAVRRLTDRPFGINLFVASPGSELRGSLDAGPMLSFLKPHHDALSLAAPEVPERFAPFSEAQWAAVLAERVPVFSFTFGAPSADVVAEFQATGTRVLGSATTVAEARQLAALGVDGIVAQGSEAGAHRATFAGSFERSLIGTIALVPQVIDAVDGLPVVASGGIMDGRGIVAAEALGAAGAQLGTAFLTTLESAASATYVEALLAARDDDTVVTRVFSGRQARGLLNAFIEEMSAPEAPEALPFPIQNALTTPMRRAAALGGDAQRQALWAGQGVPMARRSGAAELVARLVRERAEVRAALLEAEVADRL
ncbi:MAG TPA: nitronate monooxygenase family protein [Candidatus Binatia bacterium]|nr:nitronate monooxygenase family protein [Candidatus Binatia bacterium]